MGGSLRLGANKIDISKNSIAHKIYDSETIFRRHRHRYEFNTKFQSLSNQYLLAFQLMLQYVLELGLHLHNYQLV